MKIDDAELVYCDAATHLMTAQASLQNFSKEFDCFLAARDALQSHPEFSGYLPPTYFSGGDLDRVGVDPELMALA